MGKWLKVAVIMGLLSGLAFAQIQTDIYTIQSERDTLGNSLWVDSLVTVSGVVSASYGVTGSVNFFLQMNPGGPWTGIMVYTPQGQYSHANVGDSLTITGTVTEYYGNTEIRIDDTTTIVFHGTVNPPDPIVITCDYLDTTLTTSIPPDSAEAYEGVLVQLQSVYVTDTAPPTAGFEVTDGTGYVIVYNSYSYTPNLGDMLNVTGIVHTHYGYFKVRPRNISDYEFLNPGISATYSVDHDKIDITFKTLMDSNAENPSNYNIIDSLGNPLTILQAVLDTADAHIVHLTTETMTDAMLYQLTTPTLTDAGGNPITDTAFFYGGFTPISLIQSDTVVGDTTGTFPTQWRGRIVTITGVITGEKYLWLYPFFFVQQGSGPWTGVQIWDPSGVAGSTVRGDSVIIVGEVTEYGGATEIQNLLYYRIVGPSTEPTPVFDVPAHLLSSAGDTAEQYEGVLVRTTGVVDSVLTGSFVITLGGYYLEVIGDEPASVVHQGDSVDVVGILRYLGNLYSRDSSDVTILSSISESFSSFPFKIQTLVNGIKLYGNGDVKLNLYDVTGRKVYTWEGKVAESRSFKFNNLPQGIYFYSVKAGTSRTGKFVIVR